MTVDIRIGDCRELLIAMDDQSVNCVVTSPPYYGLRDYGVDRQIGLEQTPDEYVLEIVSVFQEVKRVLRDDGTLWLNLGDSYASVSGRTHGFNDGRSNRAERLSAGIPLGFKPKDLIGIPWRVAFALQADGWYLRQDIIWHKPNPMPESVRDRCTKAHEYIFLLTKSAKYYYDHEAIKEPVSESTISRLSQSGLAGQIGSDRVPGKSNGNMKAVGNIEKRNKRSVWTVTTKPFKGAHFATFPPDLIEPCILAGCPAGGLVLDPFGGAGTTGLVASAQGRNAILLELNDEYAALAKARIAANDNNQPSLFGAAA